MDKTSAENQQVLVAISNPLEAKLRFFFGTMGSGKTTIALQIDYNFGAAGYVGSIITRNDREKGFVSSRLGSKKTAEVITEKTNLNKYKNLNYLICDEAQFYTRKQVTQLSELVDTHGVDVWAYGLLTDFQGNMFEGTKALLERADETNQLKVGSRCWCGKEATNNARYINAKRQTKGTQVAIEQGEITYELRCRKHFWSNT